MSSSPDTSTARDSDSSERAAGVSTAGRAGAGIVIEDVVAPTRLKEVEDVQSTVWGMDERGIVPASLLQIAATSGGIVLAAYDRVGHGVGGQGDDGAIGFVFGLLARRDGRLYHASHMLATVPAYQGHGVGAALKIAQRDRALAQGLDLITWTFDPLIARNAHFNLRKLGAISRTYCEDYYGPMEDRYNSGLPTDRLLVEWRLRDRPRGPVPAVSGAPTPLLVAEGDRPSLCIDRVEAAGGRAPLSVQLPRDVAPIKAADPAAALAWRLAVRQALSWAFARGYVACDFAGGSYLLVPGEAIGVDAAGAGTPRG